MNDRSIEERVIYQKLRGSIVEESIDLSLRKIKKQLEIARKDSELILNNPIVSRTGPIGFAIMQIKKIIRKSVWWYVNPVCEQQNKYNEEVLTAINSMLAVLQQQREEMKEYMTIDNSEDEV